MTIEVTFDHIHTFEYEGDVAIWNYADGPIPQGVDIEPLVTHRMEGTWDVTQA